jgi:hypothetical protein
VDGDAGAHRLLVDHHAVRVARVRVCGARPGRAHTEERERTRPTFEHVGEVLRAHDRCGHAARLRRTEEVTRDLEREVREVAVVDRRRVPGFDGHDRVHLVRGREAVRDLLDAFQRTATARG